MQGYQKLNKELSLSLDVQYIWTINIRDQDYTILILKEVKFIVIITIKEVYNRP